MDNLNITKDNPLPIITLEDIWEALDSHLKSSLTSPGYQTFLSSTTPISIHENIIMIEVPSTFSKNWIKEKCETQIKQFLFETYGSDFLLEYKIVEEEKNNSEQLSIFEQPKILTNEVSDFNDKYTFENFVVGNTNRFAVAAAEAVSKAPAKAYNPLFMYGSVGLGKTHLLHAIGLRLRKTHPDLKVKLVSSEKFTNDLINAIKDKSMDQFRSKYRKVDILIVDDIQFLAGKEQTQEEFFHTFNDLKSCNKQIILTSDRPPKEIPTLEIRLRTRFEWGLTADLQAPEFETRLAILRKKNEINQYNIADDILHYIATQVPSNVREMEGALNRIVAYASLLNTDITLSIASNVIKDMIGHQAEKPITVALIKQKICDYFTISQIDLCSKNRSKELAYARQVAMYLSRELTNISLPKIGESFGNRDHSTVMHACDKIKTLINTDSETKNTVQIMITSIKDST